MKIIMFILIVFFNTSLYANEYKITRILDGDTVEISAPFLPKELKPVLYLRIEGIDTPEIGGKAKCPLENRLAQQAKLFVEREINTAKKVNVVLVKWDKYGGRVVGRIYVDDILLSDKLLAKRLAVSYDGRTKKKDWCN